MPKKNSNAIPNRNLSGNLHYHSKENPNANIDNNFRSLRYFIMKLTRKKVIELQNYK